MDSRFEQETEVDGVRFDQVRGVGNVPNNQDIEHLGLAVMMRPSVFLRLVATLAEPRPSLAFLKEVLATGNRGIASPMLKIDVHLATDEPPRVLGHEGRHRMRAVLETVGDVEVPVHVVTLDLRARHIADGVVERLRSGMLHEVTALPVHGPLFGDALVDRRVVPGPAPAPAPGLR